MNEHVKVHKLIEEAESKIGMVEIKADLLRDFLVRLDRAEIAYKKQIASLREREEARDTSKAPGGWADLEAVKRIARKYAGVEFHNLEATVGLLEHLFAAVRDEDHEKALHLVRNIDSGLDSRPWEKEA